MATTQIRGTTQIMSGTVPLSALVSGYSIPTGNLTDGANFLKRDGSVVMTALFDFGGFRASNAAAPSSAGDLTTKAYVDQKTGGIGGIHGVRLYAAANIASLSGLAAIDGITPVANDVALLGAQTTASQNGPWVLAAGAWARPSWWAAATTVSPGQYFLVDEGTTYADTKFFLTTVGTITVDTTSTSFTRDNGGVYTNGTGLSLTGGTFAVLYGATGTTAAAGNDSRITGALQTTALGANVQTALGVAIGTAGAPVVNGGALGTPSSGTLTNASGLPVGTGISGFGTGVASALAVNTGLANGLPVLAAGGVLAAAQFPALTGDITTTAGSLTTTINHTAGTGFLKYTDWVFNETPTGLVNGSNTSFALAASPTGGFGGVNSLELTYNGEMLESGAGNDFTLSGSTITMLFAPVAGDKIRANYMK